MQVIAQHRYSAVHYCVKKVIFDRRLSLVSAKISPCFLKSSVHVNEAIPFRSCVCCLCVKKIIAPKTLYFIVRIDTNCMGLTNTVEKESFVVRSDIANIAAEFFSYRKGKLGYRFIVRNINSLLSHIFFAILAVARTDLHRIQKQAVNTECENLFDFV